MGNCNQEPDPLQELLDLSKGIGPKRVKTKEIEIEAHDPLRMQRLLERRSCKPTTLADFGGVLVRPKHPGPCGDCRDE